MAYRFVPQSPRPIGAGLLSLVGNTPLVPIQRIAARAGVAPSVEIYAKLEAFNPGGSVKDRPILRMIEDAERDGRLAPGRSLLDSTSGNAGIAYAMIAAVKGYRVTLVVPANVSGERKGVLQAYGAELILSDPMEGSDGAILEARRLLEGAPVILELACADETAACPLPFALGDDPPRRDHDQDGIAAPRGWPRGDAPAICSIALRLAAEVRRGAVSIGELTPMIVLGEHGWVARRIGR